LAICCSKEERLGRSSKALIYADKMFTMAAIAVLYVYLIQIINFSETIQWQVLIPISLVSFMITGPLSMVMEFLLKDA